MSSKQTLKFPFCGLDNGGNYMLQQTFYIRRRFLIGGDAVIIRNDKKERKVGYFGDGASISGYAGKGNGIDSCW